MVALRAQNSPIIKKEKRFLIFLSETTQVEMFFYFFVLFGSLKQHEVLHVAESIIVYMWKFNIKQKESMLCCNFVEIIHLGFIKK